MRNTFVVRSSPLSLPPMVPTSPISMDSTPRAYTSNPAPLPLPPHHTHPYDPPLRLTATPPPSLNPSRWIWQCHHCRQTYPLGTTSRCLNDGHTFCNGSESCGGPNIKKRKRVGKAGACASEFDYEGWKRWEEWKKGVYGDIGRGCEGECGYPSECRWRAREAAAAREAIAGAGRMEIVGTVEVEVEEFVEVELTDLTDLWNAAQVCRQAAGASHIHDKEEDDDDGDENTEFVDIAFNPHQSSQHTHIALETPPDAKGDEVILSDDDMFSLLNYIQASHNVTASSTPYPPAPPAEPRRRSSQFDRTVDRRGSAEVMAPAPLRAGRKLEGGGAGGVNMRRGSGRKRVGEDFKGNGEGMKRVKRSGGVEFRAVLW